ncbi:Helix-turn-helix [Pedobacter steynii]|uniref:Helix-turn-helix n=1 Tax=Pedobacter steynii TaxID=430522 RepID=A0A1G9KBE4_9SPHI|nr:helix-turn-helix transcriptional regulator [Pedobacter steynii]NQX38501.1 helix-turn-helix transcriptional regulator [Pedobacter steynii]SDL46919.1 Helix-turn-helix [Pedobacter steynii]
MSKINKAEELTENALIQSLLGKIDPAEQQRIGIRMKVAGVIADQLVEQKLSKGQLAEKLGRNPSVIAKWLSGTHNFTIDTLSDISGCLAIPMSAFFTEPEEPILSSLHFEVKDLFQGISRYALWSDFPIVRKNILALPTDVDYITKMYSKVTEFRTQGSFESKTGITPSFIQLKIHGDHFAVSDEKIEHIDPKSLSKV